MIRTDAKFRHVRLSAVCALTLSCALMAAAGPRQDSMGSTASKSTTAKKTDSTKTTSTSSHKRRSASASAKGTSGKSSGKRSSRRKSSRLRGQQKIDSQRAQAIQEALIREHYLSGEPTGSWNQASEEAMRRYQADHGWQSKTVPDSRALITLGLGPSKDHLLNPESAMTTVPDAPKADRLPTTSNNSAATANPAAPSSSPQPTNATPPADEPVGPQ